MASSSNDTLDSDYPSSSAVLSYPQFQPPSQDVTKSRSVLKEKLYIGNLHPAVDEYTLIKLYSQYGKVSHLDFLYHKSGPQKGKPRGFAFVEFANSQDADAALQATNGKLIRGREVTVTYANQAPTLDGPRRIFTENTQTTTLSVLKSGRNGRANTLSTSQKIASLEAKLHEMERSREDGSLPPTKPLHPSLPLKPTLCSSHIRPADCAVGRCHPTASLVTPATGATRKLPKPKPSGLGIKFSKRKTADSALSS
ncbi:hypothetical protein DL96DRAFT_1599656 [Flagelloscypha sp. PMI_526]|nr:hypothetical protein DL96DRAFT_1599656 [Flagelloscypha sp. PMI_526]